MDWPVINDALSQRLRVYRFVGKTSDHNFEGEQKVFPQEFETALYILDYIIIGLIQIRIWAEEHHVQDRYVVTVSDDALVAHILTDQELVELRLKDLL